MLNKGIIHNALRCDLKTAFLIIKWLQICWFSPRELLCYQLSLWNYIQSEISATLYCFWSGKVISQSVVPFLIKRFKSSNAPELTHLTLIKICEASVLRAHRGYLGQETWCSVNTRGLYRQTEQNGPQPLTSCLVNRCLFVSVFGSPLASPLQQPIFLHTTAVSQFTAAEPNWYQPSHLTPGRTDKQKLLPKCQKSSNKTDCFLYFQSQNQTFCEFWWCVYKPEHLVKTRPGKYVKILIKTK